MRPGAKLLLLIALVWTAAACSSHKEVPVPTLITLPAPKTAAPTQTLVPPTPLPPTWTPRPTYTVPSRPTHVRTPRPTPTVGVFPTRTRPPEIEAALRQLSDLPVITLDNLPRLDEMLRVPNYIGAIALSPDGTQLATAPWLDSVTLYALSDPGKILRRMGSSQYWPQWLAYSPDGRQLAVGYDDAALRLWDPASGAVLRVISGVTRDIIKVVAYRPDGKVIATADGAGLILLWDVATGEQLCQLTGRSTIRHLAFSPTDNGLLVSADDDEAVHVWDAQDCGLTTDLPPHEYSVGSIAFSPDGSRLATSGYEGTIRLWDTSTLGSADPVAVVDMPDGAAYSLAFNPEGSLLFAGSDSGTLAAWDMTTLDEPSTVSTGIDWLSTIIFASGGRVLVLNGSGGTMMLWGVTH
jgi:WD40 repeat protein